MKKIEILLSENKYNVFIGNGLFTGLSGFMDKHNIPKRILAVVDKKLLKYHKAKIDTLLKLRNYSVAVFVFDAAEKNKNLKTIEKIYSVLQKGNFGRDSAIIAIGGGITGDVAAFAASTYMRGIKFIQVPTTLLSAVDSSVGGKTGVNFNNAKNFIGSFYQPEFVLIDPEFFSTLPGEEIVCGLGEAVKTIFIADEKYYSSISGSLHKLLYNDLSGIETLIYNSVKFKAGVVVKDEKESGLRKILNLGHTFAHALETESDFRIKHGQAVIWGIACSLMLSVKLGLMTKKCFDEEIKIISLIKDRIKLPPVKPEALYSAMLSDKKNREGRIKFILIKGRGKVFIDVEAERGEVLDSINSAYDYFLSAKRA